MNAFEALIDFVSKQADGATLDYVTIEQESGVEMSPSSGGRLLLHRALRRLKRPYKTIRGSGVRLSSAQNAAEFSEDGVLRVVRVSKREQKRTQLLVKRHAKEMSEDDKRRIIAHGAAHGAIALAGRVALTERPTLAKTEELPKPALPFRKKA